MENKKPKEEPVDCHKCTNAYWGCFNHCPDYKAMTHKPICKKSSVFINSDSVSMWILIADGSPIFRTEFPHMITDEEIRLLHRGSRELLKILEKNKNNLENNLIDFDTHCKNVDNMLGDILKNIDWKKGSDGKEI